MANRLLECRTAPELDFSSDHLPVSVRFQAQVLEATTKPGRCWKKANLELANELVTGLDVS